MEDGYVARFLDTAVSITINIALVDAVVPSIQQQVIGGGISLCVCAANYNDIFA